MGFGEGGGGDGGGELGGEGVLAWIAAARAAVLEFPAPPPFDGSGDDPAALLAAFLFACSAFLLLSYASSSSLSSSLSLSIARRPIPMPPMPLLREVVDTAEVGRASEGEGEEPLAVR
jgi:hypothetical protein